MSRVTGNPWNPQNIHTEIIRIHYQSPQMNKCIVHTVSRMLFLVSNHRESQKYKTNHERIWIAWKSKTDTLRNHSHILMVRNKWKNAMSKLFQNLCFLCHNPWTFPQNERIWWIAFNPKMTLAKINRVSLRNQSNNKEGTVCNTYIAMGLRYVVRFWVQHRFPISRKSREVLFLETKKPVPGSLHTVVRIGIQNHTQRKLYFFPN